MFDLKHQQYAGRQVYDVYTADGLALSANTWAMLAGYNTDEQRWQLILPNADNLNPALLVGVPEAIPANGKGVALADHDYVLAEGETLALDDLVGCKSGDGRAWKMDGGKFQVAARFAAGGTNYVVARIVGGGSGGGSTYPRVSIVCDEEIPAFSVAEIVSYNSKRNTWTVKKPSDDNLSLAKLIVVPAKVPVKTIGVGLRDPDADSISLFCDDDAVAGDIVGTRQGQWKVYKGATVGWEVVAVITRSIAYLKINDGGSGYASSTTVAIAAPANGTQATAYLVVTNGVITDAVLLICGSNYVTAPSTSLGTITLGDTGGGSGANIEAIIAGSVDSITVTAPGEYSSTPDVTVIADGDDGDGCTATANIDEDGKLTSITINARGHDYIRPPVVQISDSGGGAASAVLA